MKSTASRTLLIVLAFFSTAHADKLQPAELAQYQAATTDQVTAAQALAQAVSPLQAAVRQKQRALQLIKLQLSIKYDLQLDAGDRIDPEGNIIKRGASSLPQNILHSVTLTAAPVKPNSGFSVSSSTPPKKTAAPAKPPVKK